MTSAHEELHRLVDRLTAEQARRLLRRAEAELLAAAHDGEPPVRRRLAFTGIGASGDGHLAERVEDLLAERFNRPV